MRITDIQERSINVSRYEEPDIPSGGLTTSLVKIVTDVIRDGKPVIGYGYASIGRYAQGGLIRERFAPRLLNAKESSLFNEIVDNIDPFRAWAVMMDGEKPGGHGERCVAVGALDMAVWDAAAKIARLPLFRFLAQRLARRIATLPQIRVYAAGGYRYPDNDLERLGHEIQRFTDLGYTHAKIKIGGADLSHDMRRIDVAASRLAHSNRLAVDAMNTLHLESAERASIALSPYGLWWFEDICDPLDFATHARVAESYDPPIAAGEALFSEAEAKLLNNHGGLRRDRDILVFDPVHCYGVQGYLRIVDTLTASGWPRHSFWPHGGHLFALHLVAALDLGGAEVSPFAFQPFCGLPDGIRVESGKVTPPESPGIGFETHRDAWRAFQQAF